MLVKEILQTPQISYSFEFFPPKTPADAEELWPTLTRVLTLHPSFVSVTYGAGGTTRDQTAALVIRLHQEANIPVVAHLTCIGSTQAEICRILERYLAAGVRNILALRGDPPCGQPALAPPTGDFTYAAELVAFVKQHYPQFCIGVAGFPEGHPQTPNRLKEIDFLKAKVDAGADYLITQLFFDNRDFYDFCERCELAGMRISMLAGILPLTTHKGLFRMAELAAGARFPARLLRAMARVEHDDARVEQTGMHWATEQIRDLLHNQVCGIHIYTLNRWKAMQVICQSLGLQGAVELSY